MKSVGKYVGWTGVSCLVVVAIVLGVSVTRVQTADAKKTCGPCSLSVTYRSAQGTGLARAFCLEGETVTGGGGFVEHEQGGLVAVSLRQSYPISDATGVIAFGNTAIGWQAASSNFEDTVVAFAICAAQ
jgi:hypothetical protein